MFLSIGPKHSKMGTTSFVLTTAFQSSVQKLYFLKYQQMMMKMTVLKSNCKTTHGEMLTRTFTLDSDQKRFMIFMSKILRLILFSLKTTK